jgi:hypothetical protein
MVDLEAVGGAATGGLMASSVETPTGQAGEHHNLCADCGTETIGRFCHNCGNASHVHRTLSHLGEELLHGVMHFDSRSWRTLPRLVFRPGQLTRDWCQGKRARYVSPLALFLFTVFVIFMLLSYMPSSEGQTVVGRQAVATADLARRQSDVANARIALKDAPPQARAAAAAALTVAEQRAAEAGERVGNTPRAAEVDNWPAALKKDLEEEGGRQITTGDKKLDEKLMHKLSNPELLAYKMQQTFYKFSFLLVPISIPFVALLFLWKRGFTLYDHGVFVLYSLTFMSMLILAVALVARAGGAVAALAVASVPFIVPAHMFFQLKGAYGLSVFSAAWRTFFLLVFATIALAVFLLSILLLGLV